MAIFLTTCLHHYQYYVLLASEGGLVCSASIITLCLYSAHPTGGFLTVGDGVFSIEGLELRSSTFSNPSSKLEGLPQQYVLPH